VGVWLASLGVAASIAVAAVPSITKDRTCHNMFRDGRTSVGPEVNIDLDVAMEDWPGLTRLLRDYANAHRMSFRNLSKEQAAAFSILSLSACTEEGIIIMASEQRWASQKYLSLMSGRGVSIEVFDLRDGPGWQLFAHDLVAALELRWLGKVRFRDGLGHLVSGDTVMPPDVGSAVSR
jgi:hypothetical protein